MRIILLLAALIMALPAAAESAPSQAAMDAAGAVVAMHNAVARDVLDSDEEYTELVGADGLYMLYTDADEKCFLMVSFGADAPDKAESAVVQAYSYPDFSGRALLSMKAMYLPFMPDAEAEKFDEWLKDMDAACAAGIDVELTYYYGEYAMCAVSAYHSGEGALYTAAISWYGAVSQADISTIME